MLGRMSLVRALVLGCALFASAGAAAAQCVAPPPPDPAAAQEAAAGASGFDDLGRVVAPVMVNGQGPFRFIVDTGANRSALSEGLARRLNLTPSGEGAVHSVHEVVTAPLVRVDSLRYGPLSMPSQEMPMLEGAMLAGEHGLLGVDGMAGRRLRMDFTRRCIEIVPARGAQTLGRGWTRLRGELRFGNLVVVRGVVQGMRVNVLIDTGSNVSLANRALHQALAARTRYARDAEGFGRAFTAGDPVVLDTALVLPALAVGELRMSNLLLFVGDYHIFSLWGLDAEPTVLVGMDVVGRAGGLAIDYHNANVYLRLDRRNLASPRLDDVMLFRRQ